MALQVWLPLNEDLHNQGLFNLGKELNTQSATNIFAEAGKIGASALSYTENLSTYFSDTTNNNFISMFGLGKKYSFACWLKMKETRPSTSAMLIQIGQNDSTIYPDYSARAFGLWYATGDSEPTKARFVVNNGDNGNTAVKYTDIIFDYDNWHHIAYSFDNTDETATKAILYIDGEKVNEKTFNHATYSNGNNLNTTNANNYLYIRPAHAMYNDLRIYDHILSAEEVAEIAKGLVLHYPLNNNGFGNPNLIANSKQGGSWGYASSGYDRYAPITLVIPDKDVYTLSFEAKSTVNGDKMRTHYYSPNTTTTCISSQGITKTASDGNMDFTLTTTWTKYWVTYHQSATTAVKHVICPRLMEGQGTGTVSVRNVKFEEGSVATSWSPAKTDALYTTMKVNDSIEHDISGFGNDGTITGTLETISSGPKGTATKFGEYQSPQIYVSDPTSLIPQLTSCTLSWWEKCTDSGAKSLPFVGQDGNYYIAAGSATTRLYDCNIGTPTIYRDGIATTGQTTSGKNVYHPNIFHTYNEWHHFVYTNIDFSTWTKFRINSYGTTWPVNAYLSDVRIYATPLTADQVAQLYRDSMVVDSSGNITPRDLE